MMKTYITSLNRTAQICLLCLLMTMVGQSAKAQYVTLTDTAIVTALHNDTALNHCLSGNQLDTICVQFHVFNAHELNIVSGPTLALGELAQVYKFFSQSSGSGPRITITSNVQGNVRITSYPKGLIPSVTFNQFNDTLVISQWPNSIFELVVNGYFNANAAPACDTCYLGGLHLGTNYMGSIVGGYNYDTMPRLPRGMNAFEIWYAPNLVHITNFPDSLQHLFIDAAYAIRNIPALPNAKMDYCQVSNCPHLGSFPYVPSTVQWLVVNGDSLSSLPGLPAGLQHLYCGDDVLPSLPSLPDSLVDLSVNFDTLISHLPALPSMLSSISLYGCPHIQCLPILLPALTSLDVTNTAVTCLPNMPLGLTSVQGGLGSYPISNNSPCQYEQIYGYVFNDVSGNCAKDNGEQAFKKRLMSLNDGLEYALTDTAGFYLFNLTSHGNYKVQEIQRSTYFGFSCDSGIYHLQIVSDTDRIRRDFPNSVLAHCPYMTVDIATARQRSCLPEHNNYVVHYCNYGSANSDSAYIEVTFDSVVSPLSSTLPWVNHLGQTYRFYLGTIAPDSCGSFTIYDSVSTTAIPSQTVAVTAIIYPHDYCTPAPTGWDSSEVVVHKSFSPPHDSVIFTVKNIGKSMTGPAQSRIYEDDVLIASSINQLMAGQLITFAYAVHGTTFRIESDQRPFHPGFSKPRAFNELTGGPSYSLHHIVPIPQDDMDAWRAIDVHEVLCANDPNGKEVFPAGVGSHHYVTNQDELNYIIHFQNTGNDTAYNVVLVDTLDYQHLDIASLYAGASSAHYDYALSGSGILTFTFNNILLPDSHTNMTASEGFVKYIIRQKPDLSPGTVINNYAAIYFDNNTVVRTNTAFVTIQDKSLIFPLSLSEIKTTYSRYNVKAYPNPFEETLSFEIRSAEHIDKLRFELSDIAGRKMIERNVNADFSINREEIAAGIYLYKIYNGDIVIGTGKVIAR